MQALLDYSVQSYHPLPSDLRSCRVRTSSRPSSYPPSRVSKVTVSPERIHPSNPGVQQGLAMPVLQEVNINANVMSRLILIDGPPWYTTIGC